MIDNPPGLSQTYHLPYAINGRIVGFVPRGYTGNATQRELCSSGGSDLEGMLMTSDDGNNVCIHNITKREYSIHVPHRRFASCNCHIYNAVGRFTALGSCRLLVQLGIADYSIVASM